MDIQKEYATVGKPYRPPFPAESVSGLGRQETMDVLLEVERIAKNLEECAIEIPTTEGKIKAEQDVAEMLRNKLPKKVQRKILIISVISALIGTCILPIVLTLVFGFVAYSISFAKIGRPYLEKHKEENDMVADAYTREHIIPLQTLLEQLVAIREDTIQNGKREWAIEIVGEDLFYSPCINDLYNLVKSRRADSLKEALNKYDDEQYKAHMQEVQQATQQAIEAAAEEAKEQTKKLKDISWNTTLTAWNTHQIKRNTRRR